MQWQKLIINNFLSIEEAEVDLNNQGLVLIEGKNSTNEAYKSNGSGKSSLVGESLVYALYDTTTKGLKADDVINNVAGKNTSVILEGKDRDNTYRIERYRKHSKHKNTVKLFLNGKDISEKSTKDTNKSIERLIGIDYNTFINSILFSQGSGAGRFATATDREKKEILENLVNLDIYAQAQETAKQKVKAKQEEVTESERKEEKLNWELENIDTREKQEEQNYEQTRNMIEDEKNNIKRLNDEMSTYVHQNTTPVNQAREDVEELQEQKGKVTNVDVSAITNQMNQSYQDVLQVSNEVANDKGEKDNLVSQYKKVQTDIHCPVCGSELDPEHREKELANIKDKVRTKLMEIQTKEKTMESYQQTYEQLKQQYNQEKQQYDEINANFQNLVNQIQQKEQMITDYEQTIRDYKQRIQNSQDTLNKLNNVPKPRKLNDERKQVKDKIKESKDERLRLEKEKTDLEQVVKVYSNTGVKSHVLDLITPFLNTRANKYLATLTGSEIEVTFSTQTRKKDGEMSDKFDVQVHNSTGGATYQANSEGEKKRIDLAISLAIQDLVLQRVHSATNLVVYDEVFDALDSIGSENTITLLKERLQEVGTIFVITHSEHLKPLFESTITVTKTAKGTSRVEGA